jgi:hypothetical protein
VVRRMADYTLGLVIVIAHLVMVAFGERRPRSGNR